MTLLIYLLSVRSLAKSLNVSLRSLDTSAHAVAVTNDGPLSLILRRRAPREFVICFPLSNHRDVTYIYFFQISTDISVNIELPESPFTLGSECLPSMSLRAAHNLAPVRGV